MELSRPKPKMYSHLSFSVNDTLLIEYKRMQINLKEKNECKNAIEIKFEMKYAQHGLI